MRQFDLCRLRSDPDSIVVILQHDVADELGTRIVAPLSDHPYRRLIDRARIEVDVDGQRRVVQLDRMAAIDRTAIGAVVGSVARDESRIKNGIDLLFFGV